MSSGHMKRDTLHTSLWFLKARYKAEFMAMCCSFIQCCKSVVFHTNYTASEARIGNTSDLRLQVSFP